MLAREEFQRRIEHQRLLRLIARRRIAVAKKVEREKKKLELEQFKKRDKKQ